MCVISIVWLVFDIFLGHNTQSILHDGGDFFGFFTTARMASWNTSSRFCFFMAEHSTKAAALIFDFNFFASDNDTNFSEFGTRRSLLVPGKNTKTVLNYLSSRSIMNLIFSNLPTRMIGTAGEKCRISGNHFDRTLSNDVRLDIA